MNILIELNQICKTVCRINIVYGKQFTAEITRVSGNNLEMTYRIRLAFVFFIKTGSINLRLTPDKCPIFKSVDEAIKNYQGSNCLSL
jgi:hypothetical protein